MIELVIDQRRKDLGGFEVGRVLPNAQRRMVGPFIFFDHMGPVGFQAGFPRSNTPPFNLSGLPALALPCGFTGSGLPISLQLAGRPFDEATVLRAGHAYEQATEWHTRRPPLAT